ATEQADAIDPAWLDPSSGVVCWLDLAGPTDDECRVCAHLFHFHSLALENARAELHYPKIESYGGYLYVILHGIDFKASQHHFATHDTDFFLGPNYLVTVHDGETRTIGEMRQVCARNDRILDEGPVALMHRIVDAMVDHYRPEVEKLETKLDDLEERGFESPRRDLVRDILGLKRDISSLRRVVQPQRDVVGRLARREVAFINDERALRLRAGLPQPC